MSTSSSAARVISTPDVSKQQKKAFPFDKNASPLNRSAMTKADSTMSASGVPPVVLPDKASGESRELFQDQFLTLNELITPTSDLMKKAQKKNFADILEMVRNNQWENIIALYHPMDDKSPDLVMSGTDLPIREKVAFALGQLNRFDEAITELKICIQREPDNFYTRSSLGYTAYNSLFALKNREIMLTPEGKAKRIALAHANFEKARQLRPDGVTCCYRQGMLYSKIENKPDQSLPLFRQACENWESLSDEQRKERHQEKKNYIKSLYRLGSLLLTNGDGVNALQRITTCIELDQKCSYLSLAFKYFALGKIHFHLGNLQKAEDALVFAHKSSKGSSDDFVVELLARTLLARKQGTRAMEVIKTIPAHFRRPYFRWTEADILCSLHHFKDAEQALKSSLEKDMLSKHKTLMRLSKIYYLQRVFSKAAACAAEAVKFFQRKWGNPYSEGLFWQSLACLRMGKREEAERLALELQDNFSAYPKLDMLLTAVRNEEAL